MLGKTAGLLLIPCEETANDLALNVFFSEFSLQDFWLLLVAAVLVVVLIG